MADRLLDTRAPILIRLDEPFLVTPDFSNEGKFKGKQFTGALTIDVVPLEIDGVGSARFEVYQPKNAKSWSEGFMNVRSNFPLGRPQSLEGAKMVFLNLVVPMHDLRVGQSERTDDKNPFRGELRTGEDVFEAQRRFGSCCENRHLEGKSLSMYTWEPKDEIGKYHYSLFPKDPAIFNRLNWIIARK